MAHSDVKPVLYFFPGSFYSQKALFALEEKGVAYDKWTISLLEGENYSPWYMSLNAKGQVPLLRHGDKCIADSKSITEYIDKTFDGPPLLPKEYGSEVTELISLIDSITIDSLTYGAVMNPDLVTDSKLPAFVYAVMRKNVTSGKQVKTLEKYMRQCKGNAELEAAYRAKLESPVLTTKNLSRERVSQCLAHADKVFAQLEKRLESNSKDPLMKDAWLVCPTFTAADIALAVCMQRLVLVGYAHTLWSSRPFLAKYRQRLLSEQPNYAKVCINLGYSSIVMKKVFEAMKKAIPIFVGIAAVGLGYWYFTKSN